jgi:cbb3-type cytochrome c oxidase subunit III
MFHRNDRTGSGCVSAWAALVCLGAIATIGVRTAAQEKGSFYNAEAAKLKSPVASNEESIAAGKKLYQRHCASCHGRGGKGDGGQALSGGEPSDLTDDMWDYGSTDGEIFVVIRDGLSADMLGYKDKLKEKEIWQVVVYVRTLAPKQKE